MCTLSTGQLTDKKHTVTHQDAEPPTCPARTCWPVPHTGTHRAFGEKQLRLFCLFFVLYLNSKETNHNVIKA